MARRFDVGEAILALEEWRGFLWSASPRLVVEDDGESLIEWMPAATVSHGATSRGLSEREALDRTDRQLASMDTGRWNYRARTARASKLGFLNETAWSRVELTWRGDGSFLHWYVNFQLPVRRCAVGYETMDLIVDIVVEADLSWQWKDRDCFEAAIGRGLFDPQAAARVMAESEHVLAMAASRTGPFDPRWLSWQPPKDWAVPQLESRFPHGRLPTPAAAVDDAIRACDA